MTASSFLNERPYACDESVCRCDEFAARSPDAARMIEETWTTFAGSRLAIEGSELHFRFLPYTANRDEPNMGCVEAFLINRAHQCDWPRFSESYLLHLTDDITPHLKRAALLAQFKWRPYSKEEYLEALRSGQPEH